METKIFAVYDENGNFKGATGYIRGNGKTKRTSSEDIIQQPTVVESISEPKAVQNEEIEMREIITRQGIQLIPFKKSTPPIKEVAVDEEVIMTFKERRRRLFEECRVEKPQKVEKPNIWNRFLEILVQI